MNPYRLAGAVIVAAVLASGCTTPSTPTPTPGKPTPAASTCSYAVREDVLPEWARTGFSDPSPSGIPFVLGAGGNILGVIFGHPLTAPPAGAGRANKILWSPNPSAPASGAGAGSNDLKIDARLAGSTEVVHREVPGGPGPSIVDMPSPGCWHLTLTWADHTDTLDLRYEPAAK
jgi:hypothetical protein